ncbi:MAG TPA: NAD-dependent epimerase/dehydratase family protein [Actinomycetota bacterium]|nr:NAD-dependent epimerase/dehydratase family protein [Actinomycetota bacterium]
MHDKVVLITGGAGFLGSHFVHLALDEGAAQVVNLDKLTYAGDLRRLDGLEDDPRYRFVQADVADADAVAHVLDVFRPQIVVHYAAETHVTRSETDPDLFFRTNHLGTGTLLAAAEMKSVERFVHVSTDEVYGSILEGAYTEQDKKPGEGAATSPYARSKALADDLALSFSGDLPVVVVRPTNAFGPYQFPEKAFARWATRALSGDPLPVWGDGLYIRQWLYAGDFARAVALAATSAEPGRAYNVGPRHDPEITNIALARWLVASLGLPEDRVVMTAYDRPDHDRRYCVDASAMMALGWQPGDVWEQLASTVAWYREHGAWWRDHLAVAESIYAPERA